MPGPHRHHDEGVDDPTPLGVGIEDDPHPPEVTLELLARIAVGHPEGGLLLPGTAALDAEPLEGALGDLDAAADEEVTDLGHGVAIVHPGLDVRLVGAEELPGRTVTVRAGRTDGLTDPADQLVGELVLTAAAIETESCCRVHVAASRLPVDAGTGGDGPEPRVVAKPPSQHFFDLGH